MYYGVTTCFRKLILILITGVGFKVGGDTEVNYLVLQVHYAKVDKFLRKKRSINFTFKIF